MEEEAGNDEPKTAARIAEYAPLPLRRLSVNARGARTATSPAAPTGRRARFRLRAGQLESPRRTAREPSGQLDHVEALGRGLPRAESLERKSQSRRARSRRPLRPYRVPSLRLYDPRSRQWSLHYASSTNGGLTTPSIGEFRDGRGEFYDQETYEGRAILVRGILTHSGPDSAHFEQSFSADGAAPGKSTSGRSSRASPTTAPRNDTPMKRSLCDSKTRKTAEGHSFGRAFRAPRLRSPDFNPRILHPTPSRPFKENP